MVVICHMKKLILCQVNVRSLNAPSRLLDLQLLCNNHSIDILCLTETWLSDSKPNNSISLPGFQPPLRRDRPNCTGGGVAVYVKNDLPVSRLKVPPGSSSETLCLAVRLSKRKKLIIIVSYRPPGPGAAEYCADLDQVLDSVQTSKTTPVCIVGDFNAKCADWLATQHTDTAGRMLRDLASTQGFCQVIREPTFGLDSANPTLLDLVFINQPSLVTRSSVLPPVADHCPTLLQLQLHGPCTQRASTHFSWDYLNADLDSLRLALAAVDWSPVLSEKDVNSAVSLWSSELHHHVCQHIPLKKIRCRPHSKPWYTPFLKKLARHRDRLFTRSRGCSPDSTEVQAFRKVRNWYVAELRHEEKLYYQKLSQSLGRGLASPHSWWSKLKSATNWSPKQSIPPLSSSGSLHLSATEKADALNAVFSEQCSAPSLNKAPSPSPPTPASQFAFAPIPADDITKALSALNPWKASGLDHLSNRILKETASAITLPLHHIFNLSISSGSFPHQWKVAKVQPVFKQKGDRSDPSSYRPISLLCSVSKVFERLIKIQLLSFCLENKVIPDEQYGFLPGRSTVWQLLSLLEDWHGALDKRKSVHALFLDVSKAFDRVDHVLLLSVCRNFGISPASVDWISSYLSDRSIVTTVDYLHSSPRSTSSGVPQGSVLGPLLFLIYFSSLPKTVRSSSSAMFADDTLVYNVDCRFSDRLSSSTACCALQSDANLVADWAEKWNTVFNASKSANMTFSRSPPQANAPALSLKATLVPAVSTTRHLGLVLSSDLRWSAHVKQLIHSVAGKVFLLKRLAFTARLPLPTLSLLYCCLVRPSLEYASCVWDDCSTADSHDLERLQLSLARSFLSSHLGSSTVTSLSKSEVLSLLSLPSLAWRRRRQKLYYFWSLKKGLGPPSLALKLPPAISERSSYSLRSSHSSQVPLCSSSKRLSSFLVSSCIIWNSLPASVASTDQSASLFKLSLDKFFEKDRYSFGIPP